MNQCKCGDAPFNPSQGLDRIPSAPSAGSLRTTRQETEAIATRHLPTRIDEQVEVIVQTERLVNLLGDKLSRIITSRGEVSAVQGKAQEAPPPYHLAEAVGFNSYRLMVVNDRLSSLLNEVDV